MGAFFTLRHIHQLVQPQDSRRLSIDRDKLLIADSLYTAHIQQLNAPHLNEGQCVLFMGTVLKQEHPVDFMRIANGWTSELPPPPSRSSERVR